jgi:hypothetical protein
MTCESRALEDVGWAAMTRPEVQKAVTMASARIMLRAYVRRALTAELSDSFI